MAGRIIIDIALPQSVSKIVALTNALEKSWPGTFLQANAPTGVFDDDDLSRWSFNPSPTGIEVYDNDTGDVLTIPRSALAAFVLSLNSAGQGPTLLNVDGATMVRIEAQ